MLYIFSAVRTTSVLLLYCHPRSSNCL